MAKVTLVIPAPLQPAANGRDRIAVEGDTVADALADLAVSDRELVQFIQTRDGQLRPHVNIYIRQTDIRELDGLDSGLADGDEIIIVPSVAGG